jgi:thiamine-monophosphate kinase
MNEFDLIRRLASAAGIAASGFARPAAVGIGDDAAVLDIPPSMQLVVTTDTLVAGIHFANDTGPADLGYKALAVNLSDLAAMGAEPAWHFLCLSGPRPEGDWLERFAAGMGELAAAEGTQLAGGDMTGGPLSVTITALGLVPRGQALLRSTARPGDLVVVSGVPGLAARALADPAPTGAGGDAARARLTRPQPRLALGQALRGRATACIDVSDGLAADLGHVLEASGLGGELWLERLPVTPAFDPLEEHARWNLQLGGGDDYELCFTLPPQRASELDELAGRGGVELAVVGRVSDQEGLRCLRPDGAAFVPERSGWDHFAETDP